MNEEQKIVDALNKSVPTLKASEKEDLWRALEGRLSTPLAPIPSPYLSFFNTKKHMASIALALILMLSTTGVVAASNDARPGDTLFLVDQTVEDVRLALASGESKTKLEAKFAAERLLELSSILEESVNKSAAASASTTSSFEAEADVFTDITIVKVEINGRTTIFASAAKTREAIVTEINTRFGVPAATVESTLDFEVEDRASRGDERNSLTISQENEARVNDAVAITLGYVLNGSFGDDEREDLLEELSLLIDGVPVKLNSERLRIQDTNTWVEVRGDEDDSRVEIRDGHDRVRITEKDGEIRIDTKGAWINLFEDNNNSDDDSDDEDKDDNGRDNDVSFEAEANVFPNTTVVEVEINDQKTKFETSANTRDAVVLEIMSRFDVTRATAEASLDFEVEDRDNREDDSNDDDHDEEEDDDKDDDDFINFSTDLQLNVGDDDRDDDDN
ncbi:hypothetical protein A3I99_02715 [Candidatus Kaiserbacteria bacterium RIFCSPLOWO2_02_FULL_45_11b]|uniref:DUF5667 domain-containing protein n=1 Tax=Candidatus Kaiserbacteria bacterium RIFCSPLOWO2_12_FULL_45_26 TaxID=1798525 RepID=A0A1F6FFD0_9BACT|nr:MAG: hypothetical protein A2929_04460 [Candidatus Kaiserbacteria bacterium RIFCSPLOWO2_01_FULL_45_25]OGG81962.1 MAG: hypothetical protein A3I99_02715 [Candidatus Kaiserbacteria bacterium RIFCSPLOWO2_02_FULL_45_11b]OGG84558.1 MAG: hypothetical protein A3G90_00505 [Candidatus Kaiserbacteria bacterium RIFCSPLOWO2_12_FULL_45_26]